MPTDRALWVDEPEGSRWQVALQLLAEVHYVKCMGLELTLAAETPRDSGRPTSRLKVRSIANWTFRKLTAEQAQAEIENAEEALNEIRRRSPEFEQLVRDKSIVYELIDDYGTGSILLASKDSTGFRFEGDQ